MSDSLKHLFNDYEKVILIGADTPLISSDDINRSFVVLDSKDIVIGPAFDGGYYLIGMKKGLPVFESIEWSTEKVLAQTQLKIKKLNLKMFLLKKMQDIDTIEDLKKL